jgi:predicted nucleic acid-binding protein
MNPSVEPVFVDSSAFYALLDRDDANHHIALTLFRQVLQDRRPLLTSNFVVAETHALLLHRLGRDVAAAWLEAIPAHVIRVTMGDEHQAREIIQQYSDKDFSYCDAVSFALMERLAITSAIAFDRHFLQYGQFVILG